ncbi:MAG TPA: TetR/AcrR family transcriptional regulator [Xanthobacteraceae bacterium]|nr:TetR/AcrR family transcriptional regulator [Xanthobacteraceae bacterium]
MPDPAPEAAEFKRGRGGRPTRAEAARRHAVLLATAARLFIADGLDVVSVDEIARQARVAKRFIYGRYRDKSELFVAAIEHYFTGRLEALHEFTPPRRDVEQGLIAFGRRLLALALHPDSLALQRLFIAAAPRFPELVQRFIDRNRHRSIGEIERVLQFYAERGEIELAPSQLTAEQFFIAIVGIPQRLALAGQRDPAPAEARRLRAAVRLFLDGCRARRGR